MLALRDIDFHRVVMAPLSFFLGFNNFDRDDCVSTIFICTKDRS